MLHRARLRADDDRAHRASAARCPRAASSPLPHQEAIADALYRMRWRRSSRACGPIAAPAALASRDRRRHPSTPAAWIEEHTVAPASVHARALDWDSAASADSTELNASLGARLSGLDDASRGRQDRPMSMLVLTAIVTGPTHAIARRCRRTLSSPLHAYREELVAAARAALGGRGARGASRTRSRVADASGWSCSPTMERPGQRRGNRRAASPPFID